MKNLSSLTRTTVRLPVEGDLFAGQYTVLSLLGAGTSSKVYLGLHTGNHRRVAIKVFDVAGVDEPELWRERFQNEAALIASLRSPYTVTLFDSGTDDEGRLFQIMEYVPGTTLDERVRQDGAFSEQRTVRVLRQILESLKEAHLRGILHRDIKPANVLVYDDMGEVDCAKLLDFGVATRFEDMLGGSKRGDLVVGTPRYMSPEQLQGAELQAQSDLYSLGLLGVFLLSGEHPFANSELAVEAKVSAQPLALLNDVEISARMKRVLERLLQRDPAQRYPDAAGVIAALESFGKLPDTGAPVVEIPSGFPMTAEVRGAPTAHYMQTGEATLSMLVHPSGTAVATTDNGKLWWGWVLAVFVGIGLLVLLLAV